MQKTDLIEKIEDLCKKNNRDIRNVILEFETPYGKIENMQWVPFQWYLDFQKMFHNSGSELIKQFLADAAKLEKEEMESEPNFESGNITMDILNRKLYDISRGFIGEWMESLWCNTKTWMESPNVIVTQDLSLNPNVLKLINKKRNEFLKAIMEILWEQILENEGLSFLNLFDPLPDIYDKDDLDSIPELIF